jgi:hypothetical protein
VPGSKNVIISVPTGGPKSAVSAIQSAINSLHGKTVTNYVNSIVTTTKKSVHEVVGNANGGVWDHFAEGGVRAPRVTKFADGSENHVAQIARGGDWRMWAEPETHGEGYVPFARSKRPRSRKITEEIVRRLGGDPNGIQWNADGNVTDWRYDPATGSLYSASDAGQAGHKTKKVKVRVKGKVTTKDVDYFDIGAVEAKLKSAAKATTAWNKDLEKVADRAGGDVADALAGMGEDGMKLAHKMATGSTKYINDMAAALRNLQKTAKASLTDYTRQLGQSNTLTKAFSDNLAKLAARASATSPPSSPRRTTRPPSNSPPPRSRTRARRRQSANAAAKSEQRADRRPGVRAGADHRRHRHSKTGIHDVAAKTGLGEDEIIAVGNKAKSQISKASAPAPRSSSPTSAAPTAPVVRRRRHPLRDLRHPGRSVTFAEPETHGEAFIPLGPSKRRSALPVLTDVAHRFGLGLTDAAAIPRRRRHPKEGGDTHVSVTAVRTGATASDIGSQVGRSVRRARRGGVNARAGS